MLFDLKRREKVDRRGVWMQIAGRCWCHPGTGMKYISIPVHFPHSNYIKSNTTRIIRKDIYIKLTEEKRSTWDSICTLMWLSSKCWPIMNIFLSLMPWYIPVPEVTRTVYQRTQPTTNPTKDRQSQDDVKITHA